MADFTQDSVADMAMNRARADFGTSGSLHEIDWGTESLYWQEHYRSRPYATADRAFDHYAPAYRYGTESAVRHHGRQWDEVEPDLERGWEGARGESRSAWGDVKHAVRDAWDRVSGRGTSR